jgi:hypothetical protein
MASSETAEPAAGGGSRAPEVIVGAGKLDTTTHNPAANGSQERVYVPSAIKRFRRTKAAVRSIRDTIRDILEKDHPQTVRQVFYALTVRGAIKKAEIEYHRTVIRLLVEMRETGEVPFSWIADNTRWQRKPATFIGLDACLRNTAHFYRRDLWASMPVYVEVWCEKDALAGVLIEETQTYDVPLMVARGYSSISFLHSAALAIEARQKPAFIYHFGDLDPSGVDAARDIEAKLRRYAPDAEIHFERPAVTREQVLEWDLPSRPTKMTDSRAKKFVGTSVELDAIPATRLREIVRGCIERHVDQEQLAVLRVAEASERETLGRWAKIMRGTSS